jgi:hypothetical protein
MECINKSYYDLDAFVCYFAKILQKILGPTIKRGDISDKLYTYTYTLLHRYVKLCTYFRNVAANDYLTPVSRTVSTATALLLLSLETSGYLLNVCFELLQKNAQCSFRVFIIKSEKRFSSYECHHHKCLFVGVKATKGS